MLATSGCDPGDAARPAQPFMVIVSGDTQGWIVPCGCTSNQSGGLLRRGTILKSQREAADVIYVDAGGAPAGTSPYDVAKFEAILQGERAMQIAAHNIGGPEARLGAEYLRRISQASQLPLVSCNVRDRQGSLVGERVRIIECAGRRIAILGVLSDRSSVDGIQVDPPQESVLATMREFEQPCDATIVLAYMPESELEELAAAIPEVDIVVGGPTGQSIAPRSRGPTMVASATNKGKFLAMFHAIPAKNGLEWKGQIIEMDSSYAEDPAQKENLRRFYDLLGERDFSPSETSFVSQLSDEVRERFQVGGTQACRACHAEECEKWDHSGHAHAWESLTKDRASVDPYCQQCHTTGYGLPGGFRSQRQSQDRIAVGCESCHGPSREHSQNPRVSTATLGQAASQCLRCHDRENSPHFAYESYWPKILHGKSTHTSENRP